MSSARLASSSQKAYIDDNIILLDFLSLGSSFQACRSQDKIPFFGMTVAGHDVIFCGTSALHLILCGLMIQTAIMHCKTTIPQRSSLFVTSRSPTCIEIEPLINMCLYEDRFKFLGGSRVFPTAELTRFATTVLHIRDDFSSRPKTFVKMFGSLMLFGMGF
jgi:hypothetical protein